MRWFFSLVILVLVHPQLIAPTFANTSQLEIPKEYEELPEPTKQSDASLISDGPYKSLKDFCAWCEVEKTFSNVKKPYLNAQLVSSSTKSDVGAIKQYYLLLQTKAGWFVSRLGDGGIPFDCPMGTFSSDFPKETSFLVEDVIPGGFPEFLLLSEKKDAIDALLCVSEKNGSVSCLKVEQMLRFARRSGPESSMKRVMKWVSPGFLQSLDTSYNIQDLNQL